MFSLPARFGVATGILGSLIAWAIAGTGMLMLAFVFQNLAIRKPELDSGVFIYAKAGFGDYAGLQLRDRVLGQLGGRQHLLLGVHQRDPRRVLRQLRRRRHGPRASRCRPSGVWLFHYLIARGVRDAAVINRIVTVFKIIPILVFIVVLFVNFDAGVFADNWTAYRVRRPRQPQRAGPQHHADHDVRLHRHRGRQRLLPLRQASARTSARRPCWAS